MIINMNEKKVREAIEYLSGYIQSNINLMEKIEGIVWIGEEPCKTAIEALEKQLPKNDLISRKELISRLNNSANRYHGGKCNGVEYKDVETFDVDEVYEIIDRVWEGVPEDNGEID